MRRFLVALITMALIFPVAASADLLTVEKFEAMTRASDPQISPDGLMIAFVASVPDIEENRNETDIWMVSAKGGEPVKFATSSGADYHPRWSPDGKKLAFVSTRGGSAQIWIMPTDGGEAVQLTDLSTGANDPVWSPDGKRIAFYSFVYPDCPGDSCNAARDSERSTNPVKARVIDHLLYRHWDSWKEGKRNHLFLVDVETGEEKDITPERTSDFPTYPWGGSGEYAFSPDGKEICCASKVADVEAISTNTDLFIIDCAADQIEKLTSNMAADESPAYSPDGRYLSYRSQEVPGFEADRWRLIILDRKTGDNRELTAGFDSGVSEYSWAPDSRKIYFTAGDNGNSALFSLDLKKGTIEKLLGKCNNGSPKVSPDGKTIVFTRRSFDFPHSIWCISSKGKNLSRITNFNRDVLDALEINSAESISYKGAEGADIQAFLIKPPGFDSSKSYPAIMLIHGGPQSAFIDSWYTNWNAQTFASAGYVIFIPNFHGSDGFGQAFVNSISEDWGGKCYEDIMNGLDYLSNLPYVDPDRIGAAGASYGGYMVNWIEGHTDRFACLVSMAGAFNLFSKYGVTEELWFPEWDLGGTPWGNKEGYERWSPHNFVENFKTPCLVVHGENDFRVPVGEGLQMFTALQRQGVPSRLVYFPDEGHWVLKHKNNIFYYTQFLDWMNRYLKE